MKFAVLIPAFALLSAPALAGPEAFHPGEVITEFGPVATIDIEMPIPEGTQFHVAFDVAEEADAGELNRTLVSAARFINMQAEAGVDPADIHLAVVVHGSASRDMTVQSFYGGVHEGAENANAALIEVLSAHGVQIYVCGQSAAYYDVTNESLLPGVTMALSAMTAHALLQQDGYTLNPF